MDSNCTGGLWRMILGMKSILWKWGNLLYLNAINSSRASMTYVATHVS
jgi:hypothetical protein